MGILLYPYFLVVFWYRDFLPSTISKSFQILIYSSELLSLPLLVKTFFKPLKNEYRDGLVGISLAMGIFLKALIIMADLVVLLVVIGVLIAVNILILLLPLILVEFLIAQPNLGGFINK